MDYIQVQGMFDEMSQAYEAKDFDAVAEFYELPGALYMGSDIIVWQDAKSLRRFLKQHCACNYALGARSVYPDIAAQSISRGIHLSVWVSWKHFNENGHCLFTTLVRYFLRRTESGQVLIQIAEVAERPDIYNSAEVARPFRAEQAVAKQPYFM